MSKSRWWEDIELLRRPHFLLELKEGVRAHYSSCPCTCHPQLTGKERWCSTLKCEDDGKIWITPCAPHWLKSVEPASPEDFQLAREEGYRSGRHLVRTRRGVTREIVIVENRTFDFLVIYPNGRKRVVPIQEMVHYVPVDEVDRGGAAMIAEEMPERLDPNTMVSGIRLGSIKIPGSTMGEIQRYSILSTIHEVGGSTTKAAQKLQISVRKIQYLLKEWGSSSARTKAV